MTVKISDLEKIDLLIVEAQRRVVRALLPHNSPHRFSPDPGEHTFYLVQRCNLMKVAKELGMKDYGETY